MKQALTSAILASGLVLGALTLSDDAGHHWPPQARDMVTINWTAVSGTPALVTVYTVPANRWFVVEHYRGPSNAFELLNVTTGQVVLGGFQQASWTFDAALRDVGLAFAPGSVIAFRNVSGAFSFPQGWMAGYLE